jgi:signal transduction histidine kinase
MLKVTALLLFVAFFQLIIGLGILLKSWGSKNAAEKIFVLLTSATLVWTFANVFLLYVDSRADASNIAYFNFFNKLGFVFGIISLLLIYLFSLTFPIQKAKKFIQKLIFSIGFGLILLSPTALVSGKFVIEGSRVNYQTGLLSILIAVLAVMILAAFIFDNTRLLRLSADERIKKQVLSLLAGLTLAIAHAVLFIIILPQIYGGDNITLYAIGYFAPFYYTGFTLYALTRQGLFEVRPIIAKAVAYVLLVFTLGAFFVGAMLAVTGFIFQEDNFHAGTKITLALAALVMAFALQPLHRFFNRFTNSIFYRDAYDSQDMLNILNRSLVTTLEIEDLLRKSAKIIAENLKSEFVIFSVRGKGADNSHLISSSNKQVDNDKATVIEQAASRMGKRILVSDQLDINEHKLRPVLQSEDIALVVKLHGLEGSKTGGSGFIFVGYKKSGGIYSRQDIKLLEIIADELVIAIQNSLRFEEIQQFNVTLQQKIDEATKQLRHANHRLKELDQTKDEFISMASHQLRTPLTTIKGYLSMVLEGDVGPVSKKEKDMIQHAFDGAERMVFLIGDLLNVSRLQSGKFVIENKPMDLAKMVGAEVTLLQETAKNHHLTLNYKKPEKFPLLSLDETKIRQVIMNFIDNAIFYTPAEGSIEVKLEADDKEVRFSVTDTGLGVPKEAQHHLFSKFYRAGNARKMRPDGTGLGLFMAKKVVVAQGGAIIFNSTEGKGSTFGFSLPRAKVEVRGKPSDERQPAALAA